MIDQLKPGEPIYLVVKKRWYPGRVTEVLDKDYRHARVRIELTDGTTMVIAPYHLRLRFEPKKSCEINPC